MKRNHPICESMTDALDRLIDARDHWMQKYAEERAKTDSLTSENSNLRRCGTCRQWDSDYPFYCDITLVMTSRRDTCEKWEPVNYIVEGNKKGAADADD